jgi:hypothetical protein
VLALATSAHAQPADLGEVRAEPDADAPTAGASLDRNEAYVGDRLALTVTSIARAGIAVTLPQKLDLGRLELLERDDSEAKGRDLGDGRRAFRFLLYIAAYEVGPTEIPPITLSYLTARGEVRTVSTAPLPVSIRALVDEQAAAPEPQPARPPRAAMIEDRRVLRAAWIAGGVLALSLLAWGARRWWRARRRAVRLEVGPLVPARPPGEVAIERLSQIRARGQFEREGYRPFAFETAEVVRAYLGARYGFDSLELTSTELLAQLMRAAPHLTDSDSEVVRFLERTDLIKFAKTGASGAEALALLDAAQAIVLSTAPRLEVAAEMLSGPVRPPSASASARGADEEER